MLASRSYPRRRRRTVMQYTILLAVVAVVILVIARIVFGVTGTLVETCLLPNGQTVRGVSSINKNGWTVYTEDGRFINGFGTLQCEWSVKR